MFGAGSYGLLSQALGSIIGSKQLGAPAPAFNAGQVAPNMGAMQAQPDPLQTALGTLGAQQFGGGRQFGEQPTPQDPVTSKPSVFNTEAQNSAMQPQGGFGGFLGGIDKGLQSPSQVLGLGLLSQLGGNSNALPLAGLLGMGLFNRNR